MIITPFERGPFATVGYLITDEESKETIIIDTPPSSFHDIGEFINHRRLILTGIIYTHGHWDHTGDAALFASHFSAPLMIHQADEPMLKEPSSLFLPAGTILEGVTNAHVINDMDIIMTGSLEFEIIHTPGHTPGHIGIYQPENNVLFSGDTLFCESIGRTDLPGGSYELELQSIVHKLFRLPSDTIVYPGHGEPTTIGHEMKSNPFTLEYLKHLNTANRI